MEATSLHDFQATAEDELGFRRGNIVKVLNKEDGNWFKAELNGKEGFIPSNYVQMKETPWFIEPISREDSEAKLLEGNYPDGGFLVRPSTSAPAEFSISVKFENKIQHFKILRDGCGKYFLWVTKFNSINELVEYHKRSSVSRSQTIVLKDLIPVKRKAKALYEFQPQTPEEVGFHKQDMVTDIEDVDDNWCQGCVHGKKGMFPKAYVQFV